MLCGGHAEDHPVLASELLVSTALVCFPPSCGVNLRILDTLLFLIMLPAYAGAPLQAPRSEPDACRFPSLELAVP